MCSVFTWAAEENRSMENAFYFKKDSPVSESAASRDRQDSISIRGQIKLALPLYIIFSKDLYLHFHL